MSEEKIVIRNDRASWLDHFEGRTEAAEMASKGMSSKLNMDYIPWALAEAILYTLDPDAKIEFIENAEGGFAFYDHFDKTTYEHNIDGEKVSLTDTRYQQIAIYVKVKLTYKGNEFYERMALRDKSNASLKILDGVEITNAQQRAFAKVFSRATGVGLKLWLKEDIFTELTEAEIAGINAKPKEAPKKAPVKEEQKETAKDRAARLKKEAAEKKAAKVEKAEPKPEEPSTPDLSTKAEIVDDKPAKPKKEDKKEMEVDSLDDTFLEVDENDERGIADFVKLLQDNKDNTKIATILQALGRTAPKSAISLDADDEAAMAGKLSALTDAQYTQWKASVTKLAN